MNRKFRFAIAALLVGILALTAAGVWAAPAFSGTVPKQPERGGNKDKDNGADTNTCVGAKRTVDMNVAIFTSQLCDMQVTLIDNPQDKYAPAPDGFTFVGDTFKADTTSATESIKVCYAYPPELANKNAKIYKLNEEANPQVWVEIPGAVTNKGMICVNSEAGVFTLIGNP